MLDRDEYIEQAHFFAVLAERQKLNMATQDLMVSSRDEVLTTTKLPMAIDFLVSELRFSGRMGPAMQRLKHYFTPFQAFIISASEEERAKLDFTLALTILERDAKYRAGEPTPQGAFLYQFETIARNRLGYINGLRAMEGDPLFNDDWREFCGFVRRQIGVVEFADLLYSRSEYYIRQMQQDHLTLANPDIAILFGEKEGKIAFANRNRDPLFLFSALERHIHYPSVPRFDSQAGQEINLNLLVQQIKRMESRVRLLEEEARGGIDLTKLYGPAPKEPPPGPGGGDDWD